MSSSYTRITDAGLASLAGLDNLDRLDVNGTAIGEAPPYLSNLPALTHLEVGGTKISRQWVEAFVTAHPECYVRSAYSR